MAHAMQTRSYFEIFKGVMQCQNTAELFLIKNW